MVKERKTSASKVPCCKWKKAFLYFARKTSSQLHSAPIRAIKATAAANSNYARRRMWGKKEEGLVGSLSERLAEEMEGEALSLPKNKRTFNYP